MLNGLDLFSGTGALSLALGDWVRPVAYCENDRYAQGILLSRMADGKLPVVPVGDDICHFPGTDFRGLIDIVYGGFPCQDISYAGPGGGLEGERSGLFYELCRVVKEVNPLYVFLENVPAIRTRGLRRVVQELTDMGYDCRWTCVSAAEVGAPHRKRWFLLAHSNSKRTPSIRTMLRNKRGGTEVGRQAWKVEPDVGRVVDGTPCRVDRIRALGNGVVPQQAKEAFRRLIGW